MWTVCRNTTGNNKADPWGSVKNEERSKWAGEVNDGKILRWSGCVASLQMQLIHGDLKGR